ncbi:MAG TPA: RDD family protein [Candidatus Limnocylindrales bacterium]|jgi:uncharacterized RDD family membrane protein YckC
MNDPNAPGGQQPPAPQSPPPPPPPPAQNWQSTPQPPGPPPAGGGQPPSQMPAWTNNLTARGTMAGPGGVALADAPSRIIATFIDFFILGIVGFIVNSVTTSILGDNYAGIFGLAYKTQSLIGAIVTVAIMLALTGIYFIYTWTRMGGATIGNRVMHLSVRDQASGGPITQNQAITRWLFLGAPWAVEYLYGWAIGWLVSLLILVYYIYLLYSIANDPMRQGLHDKQAKTVVAKIA